MEAASDEPLQQDVAVYDAAAEEYERAWRGHRPLDAVRKFSALAGRGARVVDVASGPALDVRLLRDAGLKVFAGDLSHESMRVGKLFHPKGALARWDFRRLPFPDGSFAGVWAPAALQHLPRRGLRTGFRELRRVHATGPIFVSFPEGSTDLAPSDDAPAGAVHTTAVSPEECRALLLDAGYGEVEVEERPDGLGRDLTWVYGWGRLPVDKTSTAKTSTAKT